MPAASAAAGDAHLDMSSLGFYESGSEDEASAERVPPRRLLRAEAILARRTARLLLVVETLQDETNHQAILRTADSFGIQHVWIVRSGIPPKQHRALTRGKPSAQAVAATQVAHAEKPEDAAQAPVNLADATGSISMAAGRWLTLRYFDSSAECIAALKEDNRTIWVSSLSPGAKRLDLNFHAHHGAEAAGAAAGASVSETKKGGLRIPQRLAVVLGREIDGVSPAMVAAAELAVFLPMAGFSESFNVSVAAALLCQRILDLAAMDQADSNSSGNCSSSAGIGELSLAEKTKLRALWYEHLSTANPALADEYLNHWLPHAAEVERHMRALEAAEAVSAGENSAASPFEGMSSFSLLRPPEETRVPKVNRRVRKRMAAEGQRGVIMPAHPLALSKKPANKEDRNAELAAASAAVVSATEQPEASSAPAPQSLGSVPESQLCCPQCNSSDNISYDQVQTRTAQEPMLTSFTCKACEHRWRS